MKKALKKIKSGEIFHFVDGEKISGAPSGLIGDVSGLSGDIDSCEISDEDRLRGIDISEIVL